MVPWIRKAAVFCLIALLFPYIITLARTGKIQGEKKNVIPDSGKTVILDRKGRETSMDAEEYLAGVVAMQMPVDYGREALRAQAVIARTYIYGKMNGQSKVKESELQMDFLEKKEMEKLWGSQAFADGYQLVEEAVNSTGRMVMMYDGKLIDPLFHRASTGRTRSGDELHPYLQSVECSRDVEADGFLTVTAWSREEFANKINQISGKTAVSGNQVPESCQIISRDESGYVTQMQIGTSTYTGEEVRQALGLSSAAYTFEPYEEGIRAVCQGIGHGYGLSQYGAKCKAEDGWTAERILSFFYKNIALVSE